jgi:hypothetical protein
MDNLCRLNGAFIQFVCFRKLAPYPNGLMSAEITKLRLGRSDKASCGK